MPSVTICVPTFNRAELLRQTLHSLCDQGLDREQYVVAISDNASEDHTGQVVRSFDNDLSIIYRRNDSNVGMRRNCDLVLNMCDTPYLVWLPDDDLLAPGQLQRALRAFEQYPAAVLVASLAVVQQHPGAANSYVHGMFIGASPRTSYSAPFLWDVEQWLALALVGTPLSLIGSVFRTDAFRSCKGWEKYQFWADRLLLAEMALQGQVVSLPWVGGYYRVGAHQANATRASQFNWEFAAITAEIIDLAEARNLQLDTAWVHILATMNAYERGHYLRKLRQAFPPPKYRAVRRATAEMALQTNVPGFLLEHPGVQYRIQRAVAPLKRVLNRLNVGQAVGLNSG